MDISRPRQQEAISVLIRGGDVVCILAAGHVVSAMTSSGLASSDGAPFLLVQYLSCVLCCFLLPYGEFQNAPRAGRTLVPLASLIAGWTLVVLTAFAVSRPVIGTNRALWHSIVDFYCAGTVALSLWRACFITTIRHLHRLGILVKRVLLVGQGGVHHSLREQAQYQDWQRYEIVAVYHDKTEDASNQLSQGLSHLDSLDDIHNFVADNNIHEVWIALPINPPNYLATLYSSLRNALVDVKLIPETFNFRTLSSTVVNLLGYTAIDLNRPGISGVNAVVKDVVDRIFAATVLLLLAPLLLGIAVAVRRSSPGPVLFCQPRLGLNGKPFNVYKFRSMVVHAEANTLTQATGDDARITRIGRFLRRTSLDELPQFFNVLLGQMSVVGPRPHALKHNELYKQRFDIYMLRHRVKPGITGWAQINGLRGETDTDEKMYRRVQFDLHYIRTWSLWLDIKIIVWTALRGWTGANAY
jgi:putative colanic acid biosynthesis UDP-glucose lipid carrier transferase